jgi:hypothetical protein
MKNIGKSKTRRNTVLALTAVKPKQFEMRAEGKSRARIVA